jgi:hypothetical protein
MADATGRLTPWSEVRERDAAGLAARGEDGARDAPDLRRAIAGVARPRGDFQRLIRRTRRARTRRALDVPQVGDQRACGLPPRAPRAKSVPMLA